MPLHSNELIDHLDASLQGKGDSALDRVLREDSETSQEWEYIQLAVDAVKDAALYEQIGAVRAAWKAEQQGASSNQQEAVAPEESTGTVVRNIYRIAMRLAACILVVAVGIATIKYSMTSSGSLYDKYYGSYTLSSSRAGGEQDAIETAYQNHAWAEVLNQFNVAAEKTNKMYFLAGMADMELRQYDQAVEKFEQVLAGNQSSGAGLYQDEAEYYLAMSCLARNDVNEAIPILDRIRSNSRHLYHDKVMMISTLDLRIAQYKSSK